MPSYNLHEFVWLEHHKYWNYLYNPLRGLPQPEPGPTHPYPSAWGPNQRALGLSARQRAMVWRQPEGIHLSRRAAMVNGDVVHVYLGRGSRGSGPPRQIRALVRFLRRLRTNFRAYIVDKRTCRLFGLRVRLALGAIGLHPLRAVLGLNPLASLHLGLPDERLVVCTSYRYTHSNQSLSLG